MRVVVLGGTGNFSARICRALAHDADIELIVSARDIASMRHQPLAGGRSVMVYTYSFECGPRALRWLLEPVTKKVFDWQTNKRFARMRDFLAQHAGEVQAWQLRERSA
jgi:hypothetical protein